MTPALAVIDVQRLLGCSRDFVMRAIRRGDLHAFKLGRVYRVQPARLDDFIQRHSTAGHARILGLRRVTERGRR